MKLLIITQKVDENDDDLGFVNAWITEFARQTDQVVVLCLHEGSHHLPANVRVFSLGKEAYGANSTIPRFITRIRYVYNFYRYIWRERKSYNSVFVHMNAEYVILGSLFWKCYRKPVILWYTHKSVTITLRLASRLVDTVCTASSESFRLKRKNVLVTGHGIDITLFSIPRIKSNDSLSLVTIGRISRSKSIHLLIDAIAILSTHDSPHNFSIVGSAQTHDDKLYLKELKEKIELLNIKSLIIFEGPKTPKDIPYILARSDIFLHASTTGSLDKAALEAMSAGCIVISSNDAVKPILRSIKNDLVVEKPEPELFASAIRNVSKMDENTQIKVRKYSQTLVAKNHSLKNLIVRLIQTLKT